MWSFSVSLLRFIEAGFQVDAGAVDLGSGFGGGGEDWDSARDRVHEDGSVAGIVDLLQSSDDGSEVEVASSGHLEEFLFLG